MLVVDDLLELASTVSRTFSRLAHQMAGPMAPIMSKTLPSEGDVRVGCLLGDRTVPRLQEEGGLDFKTDGTAMAAREVRSSLAVATCTHALEEGYES